MFKCKYLVVKNFLLAVYILVEWIESRKKVKNISDYYKAYQKKILTCLITAIAFLVQTDDHEWTSEKLAFKLSGK